MAVETGTATDHVDLYNKLYNFLTANTELVAANQQWTEVWSHASASYPFSPGDASEVMLKGPGLAGNDNIYVSMRLTENTTADIYGIYLRAHDGVLASSLSYDDHINTSPFTWTPLFANSMPYWFVANGRRFVVVCRVTTVYEAMYAGLYLPFSTPEGFPYPVCVGGSSETAQLRYSVDDYRHTHFVDPGPRDSTAEDAINTQTTGGRSLVVRHPGGNWSYFGNGYHQGWGTTYPWSGSGLTNVNFLEQTRPLLGGGYLLSPVTLIADLASARGALGALDGVSHVPGFGNAAENILSVGGVDHLVVQNVYRTDYEGYWALALA